MDNVFSNIDKVLTNKSYLTLKYHIQIDHRSHMKEFLMDCFTRSINMKYGTDATTHVASYFKINVDSLSNSTTDKFKSTSSKVDTIFISANKNTDKLHERCKDIFASLGYSLNNNVLKVTKIRSSMLTTIRFKYENVDVSDSNVLSRIFTNSHNKALLFFYVACFVYFSKFYFDFDNTKIIILDRVKSVHCEMQIVNSYLNMIDSNNRYISISSTCCVMCALVLDDLRIEYYGRKINLGSSIYWRPPPNITISESLRDKFNMIESMLTQGYYNKSDVIDGGYKPNYSDERMINGYAIWTYLHSKHKIDFTPEEQIINNAIDEFCSITNVI
jgi:hypothetical protein